MLRASHSEILRTIPVLIAACLVALPAEALHGGTAAPAETSTYVFLPGQSTMVQTGGIAGVHWTYAVEGQFQLTVARDAGIASFAYVDANATDDSPFQRTLDPNEVFNLTGLAGTVLDDTTITFTGKAADGSEVRISVTLRDSLAHLIGQTTPPPNSADFFLFDLDAVAQRKYSGGTGETNDPYQIATAADLIALGETPEDYDKHFILTADIDLDPNLAGGRVFDQAVIAPDTNYHEPDFQGIWFTGVFNGNGHTISHLTIEWGGYLGLFGALGFRAEVRDLGVVDVKIDGTDDYTGGLAGLNTATISNCYCTGSVNSRSEWVGGLAGENWGSISNSRNMSSVNGSGICIGGIAGENSGAISNSLNRGQVSGRGYDLNRRDHIGGLVGANDGLIVNCLNFGSISSKGDYVGGLVGGNFGSVSNSYNTGPVSGSGGSIGGLVGSNEGSVSKSFWDMTSSGCTTSAGGTGLTTIQMQDPNTFLAEGWDFLGERNNGLCETWQVPVEKGYPELSVFMGYLPPLLVGAGTPDDPYMVETPEGLASVGYRPAAYYRLASEIDLSGMVWSVPVVPAFTGNFEGSGHKIRNMAISGGGHLGLFGCIGPKAVVSGLGLEDVNVVSTGHGVGCLAGLNMGHLLKSYGSGSVQGIGNVGGLVGENGGLVSESHSTSLVTGRDDRIGGLAGENQGFINNSHATGPVSGRDSVGGLIGFNDPTYVWECYSTGRVTGTGDRVGGLVGNNHGYLSGCFWDMITSGINTSSGGTGLTTAEMQTANTFLDAGWDFVCEVANGTEDIWWIDEGKDYPRLAWELEDTPLCPAEVIELDAANFDETTARGVVLVDFYATWCPHCRTQAPILEEVAEQVRGEAVIAKLDIDQSRGIAQRYGVTAIPTLILFKDGEVLQRFVGVTQAPVLTAAIRAAIAPQEPVG